LGSSTLRRRTPEQAAPTFSGGCKISRFTNVVARLEQFGACGKKKMAWSARDCSAGEAGYAAAPIDNSRGQDDNIRATMGRRLECLAGRLAVCAPDAGAWSSRRTKGSAMASRKQDAKPHDALGRARALWLPCASDLHGLVRFKPRARSMSGPNAVFAAKVSLST
jgi:hypothetical protein